VQIVRVEAPSSMRRAWLKVRGPEGFWRDGHLRRADDLDRALKDLDLVDSVVENEARSIEDVAAEVIEFLKW
jgi:hypothetical protein